MKKGMMVGAVLVATATVSGLACVTEARHAEDSRPAAVPAQAEKTGLRVGVYDSRAVAIAFAGSEAHEKWLGCLMAERDRARAERDEELIARLEAIGVAQQKTLHQQAFSTAPVDDCLVHIKDALPAIARRAGADVIISKWDRETLANYPSAERVDVTMDLVRAFHPNERQLKSAIEIQKHRPISLKQAANIED